MFLSLDVWGEESFLAHDLRGFTPHIHVMKIPSTGTSASFHTHAYSTLYRLVQQA
jgi:hypothetical protein